MHKTAGVLAIFATAALFAATPARAQCPVAWNGDEPFTHYLADGNGNCNDQEVALEEGGAYPNGFYPDCSHPSGATQTGHAHFEYTHRHDDPQGEPETKDYFERPDHFALGEPGRFENALDSENNPPDHTAQLTGGYWQVDEWIGPPDVPGATWTERFFECAGPVPCTTVPGNFYVDGDRPAYGGYWSNQIAGPFASDGCGDGTAASPGSDSLCGGAMTVCPGLESYAQ